MFDSFLGKTLGALGIGAALIGAFAIIQTNDPTEGEDAIVSEPRLGNAFYGYMRLVHENAGPNELEYTLGGEANLILHYSSASGAPSQEDMPGFPDISDLDGAGYVVDGWFVVDIDTMTCTGTSGGGLEGCVVDDVSPKKIYGFAWADSAGLHHRLAWSQISEIYPYPVEYVTVTYVDGLAALVGQKTAQEEGITFSSVISDGGGYGRGFGFIGEDWVMPLPDKIFLDDEALFSGVTLTPDLIDRFVPEFAQDIAVKKFTADRRLIGKAHGNYYLFAEDPNKSVLSESQIIW